MVADLTAIKLTHSFSKPQLRFRRPTVVVSAVYSVATPI